MSVAITTGQVAVIIPALNEELAIRKVVETVLLQCAAVFVIDDGSTDRTTECIADLPIRLLRHPQRMGKGHSLKDGMQAAFAEGFSAVISFDGDGQHSADDIPRLLQAHALHPDKILLCARLIGRETQPGLRRFANRIADFWVSWACGQPIVDSQSGQRLYPRLIMDAIDMPDSDGFTFESEVLINASQSGFVVAALAIKARYHAGRRASHFLPVRDVVRITRLIAAKLIPRWMAFPSLFRSLSQPVFRLDI